MDFKLHSDPGGVSCTTRMPSLGDVVVEVEPDPLGTLTVDDVDAARTQLADGGVEVSEVAQMGPEGTPGSRYVFFRDPDGNGWAVQEYKPE